MVFVRAFHICVLNMATYFCPQMKASINTYVHVSTAVHVCTMLYIMYSLGTHVFILYIHCCTYTIICMLHSSEWGEGGEESSQYAIGVELTTAHTIQWCVHMNCGCMKSHNSPWGSKDTKQLVFPAETCTLQLYVF